jgi:hypothetical protein
VEDSSPQILLDIECDSLLKACEGEVFKHLDELFSQYEDDEKKDSARQKPKLAFQNHIINDVPCDERLGDSEQGGKEDEKNADACGSPVSKEVRLKVLEGLASAPVTLSTCDSVFR